MTHKKARVTLGVLTTALLMCISTMSAGAAEELPEPAIPYASNLVTVPTPSPSGVSTRALSACNFDQLGDYVHRSTWDKKVGAALVASGHGWWRNVNCKATTATVTVQLQAYMNGAWQNKGKGTAVGIFPGGGSGKRAAAQTVCAGTTMTRWRSIVDVDLIGFADAPNKLTTPEQTIACKPK
jgi:hypothetical protein